MYLEGTLRDHSELVDRYGWGMAEARMQEQGLAAM